MHQQTMSRFLIHILEEKCKLFRLYSITLLFILFPLFLPDYLFYSVYLFFLFPKDYQVWWEFSQKTGHCVTSKVRLCHVSSRRYRTIWHLHYTDWGDQGCPNSVAHFLGFLEEMQSVHQHSMGEIPPGHNKNPPILVHCTAGVGRTGLTIISDLLLYTVDHNQVSVYFILT